MTWVVTAVYLRRADREFGPIEARVRERASARFTREGRDGAAPATARAPRIRGRDDEREEPAMTLVSPPASRPCRSRSSGSCSRAPSASPGGREADVDRDRVLGRRPLGHRRAERLGDRGRLHVRRPRSSASPASCSSSASTRS